MKGGSQEALIKSKRAFSVLAFFAFFVLPLLYGAGFLSIGDVNMLGRYMTFAILALGLDLLWGYVGILSLCQFTFFCLGAYAMGMHLAHHGDRRESSMQGAGRFPPVFSSFIPTRSGKRPGMLWSLVSGSLSGISPLPSCWAWPSPGSFRSS